MELDPEDVWGTHAVAHVLVMQGRIDEGVNWLEQLAKHWHSANQMRHHLWWHLCLFLLEQQQHDRILTLLTTEVRNPESPLIKAVPDATIDIQNFASLLLRLELRGVNVAHHWHVLADVCAARIDNQANAFTNAHDMMVLAATGQFQKAEELLANMRHFALTGEGALATGYAAAGVATCAAVLAHRRGQYAEVVNLLAPVRHDLPLLGASHAQRDVFYQLLVDAARRTEQPELIPILMRDINRIGFTNAATRTVYKAVH